MTFISRPRTNVGLDVGSAFVRAVGLRRTREGWSLVAAGQAPVDTPRADVRATIQQLLDELRLRRVHLAVAIPAGAAIVRRLSLPVDDLSDLGRQVSLEAEQHMPFSPDEASVSYQLLDERSGNARGSRRRRSARRAEGSIAPGTLDVLLGAARRTEVAERVALAAARGRRVGVADVEGLALANAFILNYPDQCHSALLLHIGHRSIVMSVIERGELMATRGISLGASALGHEARSSRDLVAAIRQAAPENPERVFLSGGAWELQGLSSHLGAECGAPVEAFDPRRRIRTAAGSRGADLVGPPFALAVGLALRGREDA